MEKIMVKDDEQRVTIDTNHHHNNNNNNNNNSNRNCCFNFPCFGPEPGLKPHFSLNSPSSSSSSASLWDRIRVGESQNKWWATPIKAIKKIREWSEIVAGPKWKTFIRRFNRNNRHRHGHGHGHGHGSPGKFQYDPLSYALNFDEGQGQNGHIDEEGFQENFPDFSARMSARSSMDLGKNGPVR